MKEGDNPEPILDKLNKTLDELIKFKGALMATMETANDRMDRIEVKLQDVKPNLDVKTTQVQIDKIEKEIEKFSKDKQTSEGKMLAMVNDQEKNFEILENKMEEISKFTKELDKKQNEDNKFMEGIYVEMKENIKGTQDKLRESSNEITKLDKKFEGEGRIISSLKNLIKAIAENE